MEYESPNCLSLGVMRITSRLFDSWKNAGETWHGRSGQEIWLQGFITLVSGLIDRLSPFSSLEKMADANISYVRAALHKVLLLVGQIQEVSPESRFSMRHLTILVNVVDSLSGLSSSSALKSPETMSICALNASDGVDLSCILFSIITNSPIISDKRVIGIMDKIVSWTIKESLKPKRSTDQWLSWMLKCGQGLEEDTRTDLIAHLRILPAQVPFCSSYTMMLVFLNLEGLSGVAGQKRGFEQGNNSVDFSNLFLVEKSEACDILPGVGEITKDMMLTKKQWKVLLRVVE